MCNDWDCNFWDLGFFCTFWLAFYVCASFSVFDFVIFVVFVLEDNGGGLGCACEVPCNVLVTVWVNPLS